MYCILVTMSLLHGILAPLMIAWASSDARKHSLHILGLFAATMNEKRNLLTSFCANNGRESGDR